MKKRIVALALVVLMLTVAVIGGTMAYFTDTDNATNVFTTGNVDITLREVFDEDTAKLMPGIDIQKEIYVKNDGTEKAYVRVHVAFPKILDSGAPGFEAFANTLHWNFTKEAVQEGAWSQFQNKDQVGPNANYPNWPGNGGTYNSYVATVGGIEYNVYVITYETALEADQETPVPAINKVYLDTKVTNAQMTGEGGILDQLPGGIKVLVFAEGGQEAGFTDAYTALNEQFGDPMAADYVAPWNK